MTIRFIGSSATPEPRPAPTPAPRLPRAARAPQGSGHELAYAGADAGHEVRPGGGVDWRNYGRSIWKRRWWIGLAALAATAAAVMYAQSIQPVFRSTSTMLVESGKAKIVSIEEVYNAVSQDREYFQTQVEILRSYDVAMRTVIETKLWDEPEFDPRSPKRSLQGQIKDYLSPPPPQPAWTPKALAEATVGKYLGAISIEPVRLSQLVKVSFEATDPLVAAKVADATVLAFIASDRDARLKLNQSVNGLLQDRMVALRAKLLQSEEELQKFRESNGIVNPSGSQGVAAQQMGDLNQRLIAARVRRTELDSVARQVEQIGAAEMAGSPALLNQPGVLEARNRLSSATLLLEDLRRTLGEQHSRVIEARAAVAAAQSELNLRARSAVASVRREAAAARETEGSLQAALARSTAAVQGVNRQEFQLGVLEREVQANRALFDVFLSRTKETGVNTNIQSAVARIVDPARPATAPFKPNKPQIVMAAFLAVLFSGAGASILRDRTRSALHSMEEAETRLRQPVLAALPALLPMPGEDLDSAFLQMPQSEHADAIRSARTRIVLADMLVSHKVMLVTSSQSGEGKTSFCTNLAFALAQAKRTLLIDCDLRDPQIGMRLGLPNNAKGICNVGMGTAELKDCVHAVPGSTLLVMPAGDLPSHPEELLLSPHFRETLRTLANRVDVVLIDTPSVDQASDALILSQMVNDTIYVVKARTTPSELASKGIEQLRRAGASILGVVLTNTEANAKRSAQALLKRGKTGKTGFGRWHEGRSGASVLDA